MACPGVKVVERGDLKSRSTASGALYINKNSAFFPASVPPRLDPSDEKKPLGRRHSRAHSTTVTESPSLPQQVASTPYSPDILQRRHLLLHRGIGEIHWSVAPVVLLGWPFCRANSSVKSAYPAEFPVCATRYSPTVAASPNALASAPVIDP